MRNVTILLAVAAMLALVAPASAAITVWDDSDPNDSLWSTASNWAGDAVPPAANQVEIKIANPCQVNSTVAQTGVMYIGCRTYGELQILAGADFSTTNRFAVGAFSAGKVIQSGGDFTAGYFHLGSYQNSNNNDGTYVITGGTITNVTRMYVGGTAAQGTGLLNIVGTGPDSIAAWLYTQTAKGTLKLDMSAAGAITPINVSNTVALDGALVITGGGGTTTPIPIMTYASTLTGTFSSVTPGWTVDYGVTTPGVVTIIPEPATLALLGLGGIGVLLRRRRK